MKRIYLSLMSALLVLASCNKNENIVSDSLEVPVSLHFSSGASRSVSSYSGEDLIAGVKVFITKHNLSNSTSEVFGDYYTETGDLNLTLQYSKKARISYEVKAYANFGEIYTEPSVISFKNCFDEGMKMSGSYMIDELSAKEGNIVVGMRRYVGKVTVNSIKLDWSDDFRESFILDEIYLANAGKDNSDLAECYYNKEGVREESNMDEFLYEDLGGISMNNGDIHSLQHHFYGFNGYTSVNPTSIIIKCRYGSTVMYYSVPVDLQPNSHYAFDFIIKGAGSDVPYGEKVQLEKSPIEVVVRSFTAEAWDRTDDTVYSEETTYSDTEVGVNPDYE